MIKKILLGVLLAVTISSAAVAGSGTVNYNSSGSTPFGTVTDSGGNNYSAVGIVDGAAAANKAAVNASGQLNITGPVTNAGTFATQSAITAASGSFSSGAFSSGSFAAGAQVDLLTMRGAAAAGTAPSYMLLGGSVYNLTPITAADTQSVALQSDANGYLKVNIAAGAAAGGTSSTFGAAFPATGTAIGLTNGTNMIGWSATTNYGTGPGAIAVPAVNAAVTNAVAVTNTGTFAVQSTLQASATTAIGKVDPNTLGAWGIAASTQNGTTPTNGHLVMGQFNTSPTTVTNGNISPLQMDAAGNLLVNIKAGGAGTSSAFGSAFPANGTAIGLTNGTNMVGWSAASNYGTSPGAIAVPAVNASVTNSVAVTAVAGALNSGSIASGAMVDLGVIADAASTAGGTGTVNAKLRLMTTQLGTLNTTLGTPMQATGGTVTANAGTNLNTSALATSANLITNAATTAHTCSVAGYSLLGCMGQLDDDMKGSIPAGTNAIGSITNTTFAATQATAANLNATVVGTGTFAVQLTGAANNINNISGTVSLPTGAATAALQSTAATIGSTTSGQTGKIAMGAVTTGAPTYTTAQTDPLSLTTAGALRADNTSWAGTALGAPSNYGTSPGTVAVPGVNAFVTNSVTVTATNLSANTAQVNGVTTLTGAGATGTGAQRVTVSQDATTIAGSAPGTAGSASTNVLSVQGIASGTALSTSKTSQYPAGAVPLTASATGTTAATTATLAGTSGKTTYICSYSIRANATAAVTVTNTVTGVITGTMSHIFWVAPAASGLGVDEQVFTPCVPASTTNTAIAVVSGAPGTGGNVSSTATGYQL